ncbi:MAG: amino acid permease [Nanoarchaeota archaeon]|nr:amino acid permease [Nanoarchaeota archaeon]
MGKFATAVSMIVGTVIGAGVLGIPYAISKSGFIPGMITMVIVGIMVTIMTLYMGEVVLRTKGEKQFTALAKKYLGEKGKWLMLLFMIMGIFGALIAYLVGIGETIADLVGGNSLLFSLIFFAIAAPITFKGLKAVSKVELTLASLLVAILFIICLHLLPQVKLSNLTYFNLKNAFVPYGVVLFACLGYQVIPEVKKILTNKKQMSKVIIIALSLCLGLYAFFAFSFVGTYNQEVREIAIESLSGVFHVLGTIVAVLAMSTGFLALSIVLKDVLHWDFGLNEKVAWAIVSFLPLLVVLVAKPGFVTSLALTGTYAGGLTGILSVLIVKEARKKGERKPEFVVPGGNLLIYILIVFFVLGMILQF